LEAADKMLSKMLPSMKLNLENLIKIDKNRDEETVKNGMTG
jgi:hypothetical protein